MKRLYIGLVAITIVVVSLCIYANRQNKPTVAVEKPVQYTYTPQAFLVAVNRERAKVGSKPLVLDERLNKSAQLKADELRIEGWGSNPHINSDGIHGYEYAKIAVNECEAPSENLTGGYSLHDVINRWLNSSLHKEAMLSDKWELTGFGITKGNESFNIVQHFCDIN